MTEPRGDPFVLPSGLQVELASGEQRVTLVEVGGGLRAYAVGSWEVLDGYPLCGATSTPREQVQAAALRAPRASSASAEANP